MAINDPLSGVVFDPDRNTVCLSSGQSQYPLYHCPFCGGAFPDSSQPLWVPVVPQDEFARLEQLVGNLTDPEAIISQLGPPDYDATIDPHIPHNGTLVKDNLPPVRNIEYYGYSEWLAIEFYVPAGQPAKHRLVIKLLSPKHGVCAEPGAPPNGGPTAPLGNSTATGGPPSLS